MIHTSSLGWVPGESVSAKMQALVNTLTNGETVVFDAFYKIAGKYRIDHLTDITFLAAAPHLCGLDCLDGLPELSTRNGLPANVEPVFEVGNGFTVDGLLLTQGQINPSLLWGGGDKSWFRAQEKTNVSFLNLFTDTMGWICANLRNTPNAVIYRCHFDSLKECVYMVGSCDDAVVSYNYFTGGYTGKTLNGQADQIFFDGVKTYHVNGRGPRNALVTENRFINIVRDAIDTTGGFKDAIISHNIMRNVAIACLDLKSLYNTEADCANGSIENTGVRFEYNLVDGIPSNALVATTTWSLPRTPEPMFAAGPILSRGNIYRTKPGYSPNFVLNKNARGVISTSDTFVGHWSDSFIRNIDDYNPDFVVPSVLTDPIYIG